VGRDGSHPEVWVVRHGETEWSRSGRHTSLTDVDLTEAGEEQAEALGSLLRPADFGLVLSSPMLRSRRTAELAGFGNFEVDPDLLEWDYGDLEGRTTAEIQNDFPGWSIWKGPWPGGETDRAVGERADRVVASLLSSAASKVAVFSHGHFIRVLAARWVGAGIGTGEWLDLDTAAVSKLGWYRSDRVLRLWNLVPGNL
jgi:broad specificity phosphatase PhoE